MKTKYIVIAVVVALAIAGGYYFPQVQSLVGGSNAAGTTFSSAKIAAVNITPSTGSATSSSLYNGDGGDRYIQDSFVGCESIGTSLTPYTGTGMASNGFGFIMATTSSAITGNLFSVNPNYAASTTVATSTAVGLFSSTTEGVITGYSRIWPASTYLTIQASATNTATCTAGVHYIAS